MVSFLFRLAEKDGVGMLELSFTAVQLRNLCTEEVRMSLLGCTETCRCSLVMSTLGFTMYFERRDLPERKSEKGWKKISASVREFS